MKTSVLFFFFSESVAPKNPVEPKVPSTAFEMVMNLRRKTHEEPGPAEDTDILQDPVEQAELRKKMSAQRPVFPEDSPAARSAGGGKHDAFDTKGYKTYRHIVPNFEKLTRDDVITMLKKSVIYNERKIFSFPAGLNSKIFFSFRQYCRHQQALWAAGSWRSGSASQRCPISPGFGEFSGEGRIGGKSPFGKSNRQGDDGCCAPRPVRIRSSFDPFEIFMCS